MLGITTIIWIIALAAIIIIALPAYFTIMVSAALNFMIIWLLVNLVCRVCFKMSLVTILGKLIDKLK